MLSDEVLLKKALARCGLSKEDLVVKSFDAFCSEATSQEHPSVTERKFVEHQETVARNMQQVIHEKQLLMQPKPPSTDAALTLIRAADRRAYRHKEVERQHLAKTRKSAAELEQEARLEEHREKIQLEEVRRQHAKELVQMLNAEKEKERFERDEEIAQIRRLLITNKPPLSDTCSSTPSRSRSTRTPSPRKGPSAVDTKISAAASARRSEETARREEFNKREQEEERRELIFQTRLEIIAMERNERSEQQRLRNEQARQRADRIALANSSRLRDNLELSVSRSENTLENSIQRRQNQRCGYALAKEQCLQNALQYRLARQQKLYDRFETKQTAEEIRRDELAKERSQERKIKAAETEIRFQKKELTIEHMDKAREAKAEDIRRNLEARFEKVAVRRQMLQDSVYS